MPSFFPEQAFILENILRSFLKNDFPLLSAKTRGYLLIFHIESRWAVLEFEPTKAWGSHWHCSPRFLHLELIHSASSRSSRFNSSPYQSHTWSSREAATWGAIPTGLYSSTVRLSEGPSEVPALQFVWLFPEDATEGFPPFSAAALRPGVSH